MGITMVHDTTVGDLCGCAACDLGRMLSLAWSRRTSAVQAAAWHPRSRKLAAAAVAADAEYRALAVAL